MIPPRFFFTVFLRSKKTPFTYVICERKCKRERLVYAKCMDPVAACPLTRNLRALGSPGCAKACNLRVPRTLGCAKACILRGSFCSDSAFCRPGALFLPCFKGNFLRLRAGGFSMHFYGSRASGANHYAFLRVPPDWGSRMYAFLRGAFSTLSPICVVFATF